ncbi:YndJ-like protein [Kribbella sp. VKM Ac-2571]|uniref:YndJ family protein n=1 Tax=Kribbella sp. VKM Ac-2571 TaxID=2512222 RepID=UPI00105E474B|nr:YndJ family protein [Kribbella sp. VKM Ac-2571]TDO66599.1 YndJ-like protein [Kribbella sp. VKM Ac-2571]
MIVLVHAVVSLGMLIVVPLGLTLLPTLGRHPLTISTRWWFAFAVPGAVALWLPRGAVSIVLASVYFVGTLVLIALAARHFFHARTVSTRQVALYTALATPSIAALALVAERSSYELFGFNLTVLSLTVAHFHFAGFAAALMAYLAADGLAAVSVPLGTAIVLLGFFLGDPVELVGAVVLTTGMWLVGWNLWKRSQRVDRTTAILLTVSGSVLVLTMLLAISWALGHVVDTPYLPLEWMVATHGVANAVGFALCGVLAMRREGAR